MLMGKRASNGGTDGAVAFRKRQKVAHEAPTSEDVESGDQLRRLLAFDQDLRRARHGLQSFKKLLDEALSGDGDRKAKLAILQQYLEIVRPRDAADNDEAIFLGDIMEMWSFAAQVNDDGVMSSVAVVLALLLQALSESLHLVPHGLGVCRTLLQERQLKSLSRNLSAEKGKGFIISPTLRLLREAVCLDGGAYARRIVRERSYTFTSLGRNLEIGNSGEGQEDSRRASVRTNAVRFFLSCLKYLHPEGRKELLSQRELISHLTYMIKADPPYLVSEILDTLKAHVLADTKIPREVKLKSFNTKTLVRFLALYSYSSPTADPDDKSAVIEKAHEFLMYICTTPSAGVLYPYKGLYPKESDEETSSRSGKGGQVRVNGDPWEGRFRDGTPVFNFVLSEFAAKLRPWSSLKHSELLVAMFSAAPELIADYFYNNRSFTFEPKLSMTWIGYAAFLFSTMTLPLPSAFGDPIRYATLPPPTSVLLDNIIPPAINEKVLIRCLSPKSHLTAFFATRILVAALEKLNAAVGMLEGSSSRGRSPVWSAAARRLVDAFCQRIPDMKEVVRCYKSIPSENALHKTLASRLLRLYYEVIPRVALAANFDVSPLFVDILKAIYQDNFDEGSKTLATMELENLVSIASYSPGMRWFSKIDGLGDAVSLSAFTALLRLLCDGGQETPDHQLKTILTDVAIENQLVSRPAGLRPLLKALQCTADDAGGDELNAIWALLDSCINRCATSPIKYLDQLKDFSASDGDSTGVQVSLLGVALVEQTPYATTTADSSTVRILGRFLSLFFTASRLRNEDDTILAALYQRLYEHMASKKVKLSKIGNKSDVERLHEDGTTMDPEARASHVTKGDQSKVSASLKEMLQVPLMDAGDAAALVKWASKSVEDLVEDGWAANLVRLLSSEHTNIRKEALVNILKMAAQIKESSYEEKTQIWLLLSEVAESSRAQVEVGPVPSAFTAFTIHSLDILRNPLHPLYPKVNSFMTRSPVWALEKLPLAHDILHGEPSEDDRYYTELAWLLTYLLDSLNTPFDLGVFHKKKWFEKILALGNNPYLKSNLQTRILKILYRATCIEAGSTTLVTRFGVMSWLDAQRAACRVEDEAAVFAQLMRRVWDTCDQKRVAAWSKGGIMRLLDGVLC
ncbi:ribosome biogenesis protein Urb1 [Purpureocillium lavendulum]|uniref:Ribosome biogenesis protein Urb1 n=1 Tax=Purpureocillium lavendulum TaxID=1247861 RepID=A0AB34FXW6_9HYPO|nr:ribosome biogenesis protein Urb1 [Purpureocillium lavendulum]